MILVWTTSDRKTQELRLATERQLIHLPHGRSLQLAPAKGIRRRGVRLV